ncbi:MAG: phenylalanine--tRNA ligase subunit alpha [Bacillales bacterium]|nr:phenylalanine--tRNA ligase subunit alpha [Mollicutes bacterium]MCI7213089.1 phenylalanine--tRNA ligase subunit alpha [Bacillales bacterium]
MEDLDLVLSDGKSELNSCSDSSTLDTFFAKYLSKKGKVSSLMGYMKEISKENKAAFGMKVNAIKNELNAAYEEKKAYFEKLALNKKLQEETIDISLPGREVTPGRTNPYYLIIDEVTDIFLDMGYEVKEGRDVETDEYNFELLNVPVDHPARDMQDTFYFDSSLLLRTQTSAAQAHTMKEKAIKTPIKIICPGKAYRRDDDDMTHSHQFAQIEGLVVDKNISIANLKATLELFAKKMFGEKRQIRLRSSYFPFTEPSVEVDVSCFSCNGKGCALCKNTGWIEILGAGMVNPKVLEMCGYDPEVWSGFAFGVGVERVAMLRYGIDDIRRFYQNDVRFLSPFKGK